ncbi:hypothetical protein XELAEV_18003341mg [Xenopus laevis]|nr:hypothetical protein XELAEV_18003341mg [Xenopus laevis]
MSKAGGGYARTKVSVADPPPMLTVPHNITTFVGGSAVLSCEPSDAGEYQCTASNHHGATTASLWLTIQAPPSIEVKSSSMQLSHGEEVTLRCDVSGNPVPQISWKHDDFFLMTGSRYTILDDSTLLIKDAGQEDAGNYSCVASNSLGTDEQSVFLTYVGKDLPRKPNLSLCCNGWGLTWNPSFAERPKATAVKALVQVPLGEDAILECLSEGLPLPVVTWYKDDKEVTGTESGTNGGTLRLQEVRTEDGGKYACVASNDAGTASDIIQLDVGTPPQFVDFPLDVEVEVGESAKLPCSAEGNPAPQVSWFRQDEGPVVASGTTEIIEGPGSNTVHFKVARPEDAAVYVCEARNAFGWVQAEILLSVTGLAAPKLAVASYEVTVLEGRSLTLPCTVVSGNPLPVQRWTKDSQTLQVQWRHTINGEGGLIIEPVQREDAGKYVCEGDVDLTAENTHYYLNKDAKPRININGSHDQSTPVRVVAALGAEITLPCDVEGSPLPVVSWRKDSLPLPIVSARHHLLPSWSLRLSELRVMDSGYYTCLASNPAGNTSLTYSLEVQGTPTPLIRWMKNGVVLVGNLPGMTQLGNGSLLIESPVPSHGGDYICVATNEAGSARRKTKLVVYVPPTIYGAGSLQDITARDGSEVELQCKASGVPRPQVEWTKDGQPLPPGEGHIQLTEGGQVLRLNGTRLSDQGRYQCLAFNHAGQQVKDFNLRVHTPPTIWASNETTEVASLLHGVVELRCEARASPVPGITWFKDKRPIVSSSRATYRESGRSLQLSRVLLSDAGTYTCRATNNAGTAEKSYRLEVYVSPDIEGGGSKPLPIKAILGHSLELECSATGHPPPTLSWLKDGLMLSERDGLQIKDGGRTLHIGIVSERTQGTFTCVAISLAGENVLHYVVTVLVPPKVLIGEGSAHVTVTANDPLDLSCHATGYPTPTIQWLRNDHSLSNEVGVEILDGGKMLTIRQIQPQHAGKYICKAEGESGTAEASVEVEVQELPSVTIAGGTTMVVNFLKRINSVSIDDEGVYTCVATNFAGEGRQDVVLTVLVPPNIEPSDVNQTVVENLPASFECLASGSPLPIVSWYRGEQLLSAVPGITLLNDGKTLQIENAQSSDSGEYRCVASNTAGSSEFRYNLLVYVAPRIVSVMDFATFLVNEQVWLECNATGVPEPTVMWLKDQVPVSTAIAGLQILEQGRILSLEAAHVSDSGIYTCIAVNPAGEDSHHIALQVYVPPSIMGEELNSSISVNQPLLLECQSIAIPPPVITWLKDGRPLLQRPGVRVIDDGHYLQIDQAQLRDAGRYTCEASNDAGRTEKHYNVIIWVPPSFPEPSAPHHSIIEGQPVSFTCECTGVPAPTLTWTKDGLPLEMEDSGLATAGGRIIQIGKVQVSDEGSYMCECSNEAGSSKREYWLEVYGKMSLPFVGLTMLELERSLVTLECVVSGKPSPSVTWLKDGFPLGNGPDLIFQNKGQQLTIPMAQPSHSGRYVCVAVNAAGQTDIKYEVFVHDAQPVQSRDEVLISPDGSELHILSANVFNVGHYTCVATNSIAERSRNYVVTVLVSPTISGPLDDEANEDVIVIVNNPFSLICEALGFPIPSVTWLKNGEPFKDSDNLRLLPGGHGLQILNAQEEDSGQYTCVVTNEVGEAIRNYEVKVFIPPVIKRDDLNQDVGVKEVKTKVNSSLTLQCESQAVPKPTLHWYKDGQLLESSGGVQILSDGQELQIQPIRLSDSGRYTCVATNVAGEDEKEFYVNVQVPPIFHRPGSPSAAFELVFRDDDEEELTEHREVVATNPISLYCDTNAIPPPILTWYKDGQLLSSSDGVMILLEGRILQIPLAHAKHAGKYTCEATNEAGEDRLHYELLVLTPPVMKGEVEELIQEVSVIYNQTAELNCDATGIPSPSITWLRNGLTLSTAERYQLLNDGKILQIHSVEVNDIDSYVCVAENPAGFAERLFTLMVHVTPIISGPNPENISAVLQNSVSLLCDVQSHPTPEIMWYKDGQLLTPTKGLLIMPGGQVLQIARVQLSNQGIYMCKVHNPAGSAEKLLHLTVYVPPSIKEPPMGKQEAVVRLGDNLALQCESDAVPRPTITWYKNGQQLLGKEDIQIHDHGQRLEILDIKVQICFLYPLEIPATIIRPQNETLQLIIGNSIVLSCEAEGSPPPMVTWLKDGEPLEANVRGVTIRGSRLQISRVQQSHTGHYRCIAQNSISEAHKDFVLLVQVAPRIFGSEMPSEHSVPEEQEVKLECRTEGSPPPQIMWFKDGSPLDVTLVHRVFQDGTFLVLRSVQASDSGRYTCVARNNAGEDTKVYVLNILVPPTFESGSNVSDVLSSVPGGQVTLECHASGSLPLQLSWFKDGHPLSTTRFIRIASGGRILRISQVQVSDAGTYRCVASSPAGAAEKSFILHIESLPILERSESTEEVTAIKGASVTFTCEAHGTPLPSLSWEKDGQPLNLQSNLLPNGLGTRLHLESVHALDSGIYSCIAVNAAGKVSKHFHLTVLEPPRIEGPALPTEVSIIADSPLELACTATGVPTPEISWEKDGRPLSQPDLLPRNGTVLRIERVKFVLYLVIVDGGWTSWSRWAPCSSTCGEGSRQRTRSCFSPPPQNGGKACAGKDTETEICQLPPCQVGPSRVRASVIGIINDQDFGISALSANLTENPLTGLTTITSSIENIPPSVGHLIRVLVSVIAPLYWSAAFAHDDTVNGFSLTKGVFRKETQLEFATGEQIYCSAFLVCLLLYITDISPCLAFCYEQFSDGGHVAK